MRHRIFGKKLGRTHNQRQALIRCLTRSLFTHGSIQTTKAKAELVTSKVESLSTIIMTKPELTAKRELFRTLQSQVWVNNVVKTMKEVFGKQTSNFTKISKIGRRFGDDSLIVKISFVKPIKFETKKAKKVEEKPDKKGKKNKPVTKKNPKKTTKKETK